MNASTADMVDRDSRTPLFETAEICRPIETWALLAWEHSMSGMRPGKFLLRNFFRPLKEGAEALKEGLIFSFSYSKEDFVDGYEEVHSCMRGKGSLCHEAYSKEGVGIFLLRSQDGTVLARSLGFYENGQWYFVRCYGEYHYILQGLFEGLEVGRRSLNDQETLDRFVAKVKKVEVRTAQVPVFRTVDEGYHWSRRYQRVQFSHWISKWVHLTTREPWYPFVD